MGEATATFARNARFEGSALGGAGRSMNEFVTQDLNLAHIPYDVGVTTTLDIVTVYDGVVTLVSQQFTDQLVSLGWRLGVSEGFDFNNLSGRKHMHLT